MRDATAAQAPPRIPGDETVPAELLDAFHAYERAVVANDLDALDAWFDDAPDTLRGDEGGLLVGHDAISAFRAQRGGVAPRAIERIEHRPLADGTALLVSVSRFDAGGRGLQTQIWRRRAAGWRIVAAHVSARPRAFDRAIWREVGEPLAPAAADGPLSGLSFAVKDLFAIAGSRVGAGNPAYLDEARPATTTAPAVSTLLGGGAALRGIARTDEFAYSIAGDNAHYGTPPNGALPGALPGGSSSGPASAVALGQADIGLATDTAGSIRVPASYQGLWGLRTTHGRVPRRGVLPLAPAFDTVGWLTRDGETLERVASWCLDGDAEAPLPWRFRVPVEALELAEPAVREAFEELLAALGRTAPIERVSIGDLAACHERFRTVQAAEAWRVHGAWLGAHPGALGGAVAARFAAAAEVTPFAEQAAREQLRPFAARVRALVGDAVLILPVVPGPAPSRTAEPDEIDAIRTATLRLTAPAAVAGAPSISAPLLTVPSALGPAPVGVGLIGRSGSDLSLVRLARALADAVS